MRLYAGLMVCVSLLLMALPPAQAETIYACVHDTNGKVRIVQAPGLCHDTEYEITWSEGDDLEQVVNSLVGRIEALEGWLGIINDAPSVECGNDLTTLLANPITLGCTASDDGLLEPLSLQWSKVEGPGNVTFGSPNDTLSEVSFDVGGEYVVRLSAYDGAVTVSDSVAITVVTENAAPTIEIVNSSSSFHAEYDYYFFEYHVAWSADFEIVVCDDGFPGPFDFDFANELLFTYTPDGTGIDWDSSPNHFVPQDYYWIEESPDAGCTRFFLNYEGYGTGSTFETPDTIEVELPVEADDGWETTYDVVTSSALRN